jgi:hypothetical protein
MEGKKISLIDKAHFTPTRKHLLTRPQCVIHIEVGSGDILHIVYIFYTPDPIVFSEKSSKHWKLGEHAASKSKIYRIFPLPV